MLEELEKKPRKKKERFSNIDSVMTRKMYGDEPSWHGVKLSDEDYKMKKIHAMNWASANFDPSTLKKLALEYFGDSKEHEFLKNLQDNYFVGGIGIQAWLRLNNAPLAKESEEYFKTIIDTARAKYELSVQKEKEEKAIEQDLSTDLSADQIAKIEYVSIYSSIDNMIRLGDFDTDRIYEIIRAREPSQTALRMVLDHYTTNVEDCDSYEKSSKLKGNAKKFNNDLRAGSVKIVQLMDKILSNVRAENKLKVRKMRKRKVKPAQMQVKQLKFKESDSSLKLVSIPPTAIVAAPTLITYNTKSRKVSIFYAKNTDGLTVKGTTIQNYDTERSKQKILRKPEEMIEHLTGTSLFRFEKVFAGIKAKESKPTGRINEDTLLLKIFKS